MIVHRLPLTAGHVMHVEEHGNPSGLPALLLHGGPGSGSSPLQRSFFDPTVYRILCPDQRGAGKSTPRGSIEHNTLPHLLADLRLLRAHLQVDRWLVVGGSWGATLALLHALDQPDAVAGLLLRNIFLARPEDIECFFAAAMAMQVPGWAALQQQADAAHCSLTDFLADLFATAAPAAQREAAACWWRSEQILSGSEHAPIDDDAQLAMLVDRYRVQSHYLRHGCWIEAPGLLARCDALPRVPMLVLQGTEDAICPPAGALALAHACGTRVALQLVPGAGHDPGHPAMAEAMRHALQAYARHRTFAGACD